MIVVLGVAGWLTLIDAPVVIMTDDTVDYEHTMYQIYNHGHFAEYSRAYLYPLVWGISVYSQMPYFKFMFFLSLLSVIIFAFVLSSAFPLKYLAVFACLFGLVVIFTKTNMSYLQIYLTESILLPVIMFSYITILIGFYKKLNFFLLFVLLFAFSLLTIQYKAVFNGFTVLALGLIAYVQIRSRKNKTLSLVYAVLLVSLIFGFNRLLFKDTFNSDVAKRNQIFFYQHYDFPNHYLPFVERQNNQEMKLLLTDFNDFIAFFDRFHYIDHAHHVELSKKVLLMTKYFFIADPIFMSKIFAKNIADGLKFYSWEGQVAIYNLNPKFSFGFKVERILYLVSLYGFLLLAVFVYGANSILKKEIFGTIDRWFTFTLIILMAYLFTDL